jgi:digeranylgeranylglycerophospholipid reductase
VLRRRTRRAVRPAGLCRVSASPDLLVVGLGPAGSRAAAAASSAGLDVLAIDRRRVAGEPVQCAEFVPLLLDQEVAGLGAVHRQAIGRMWTAIEQAPAVETPGFHGRMLDRARFDALLAARAAEAGARLRFAVALEALDASGLARLSDGTLLRPRVVIGADGPRSRVGAAIGSVNREVVEARQVRVRLLESHDATDIFLSADYPGGYGWLFPCGGTANLGLGVVPAARAGLKKLLDVLHARLAREGRVGADVLGLTGGAIPVGGRLRATGRLGGVGVLLAGDAAGLAHPVSGAGIASAVLSGSLAGAAAATHLGGSTAALADYEEELSELFDASFARALRRRRSLLHRHDEGEAPGEALQRASWIGFEEYWGEIHELS